ncbi:MAG: acetyl-CoA carboxylase carboxyl transferase subunit beta [Alphaproteobacteria bacterium]|nr:acetyl-CoA carboxylase carboxyl transferase subunit beta [Alphaproteobacteria bacterium]
MKNLDTKYVSLPKGTWGKCKKCGHVTYLKHLDRQLGICAKCQHPHPLSPKQWFEAFFDEAKYSLISVPRVKEDPLNFSAKKNYKIQLEQAREKTGESDASLCAFGLINGLKTVVFAMDFNFIGGSMGREVGEAFLAGVEKAVQEKSAFLAIPVSGGARMQESTLSLMQLPRSILGVQKLREAKLPYIVYLTNPTFGGVPASFAMVGDLHIAEPNALIGFAGPKVIEQNIRQKLPKGFQTAEYLVEHGMVDMIIPRDELKEKLGVVLSILMKKEQV